MNRISQVMNNILSRATTQGAPSYGGVTTCGGLKSGLFTLQQNSFTHNIDY